MARSWITTTCLALLAAGTLAACSKRRAGTETASNTGTSATDTTTRTSTTDTAARTSATDTSSAAVPPPDAAVVALGVADVPGLGVFLIGPTGHPVYIVNDSSGTSSGKSWQPVTGTAAPAKGDTSVKASLIGTAPGPGGTQQATYNGHPLYYYRGDSTAKDTKGQGHKENRATSYLVSPQGKAITRTAK
jgi:hypothetical protein